MKVLVLTVFFAVLRLISPTLLASSTIQACRQSGTGIDTGAATVTLGCSQALVATLTVQNNAAAAESIVAYSVPSAQDAAGLTYDLADTLEITLFKSTVELRYALTYVQDVNDGPYEIAVYGDGGGGYNPLHPCNDDASSSAVSCGWVVTPSGSRVASSQGFCCACSASDYLGMTTGGARDGLSCNIFASSGVQAANCLRMAPLWHAAFALGPPRTDYSIVVALKRCAGGRNTSCMWDVIALSPSAPVACVRFTPLAAVASGVSPSPSASPGAAPAACDVQASLAGDFAAFQSPPDLGDMTLFAPVACDDWAACGARMLANASAWLLLPNAAVDLSGAACNKVGVSYEAYIGQGSRCDVPAGSCLGGQLRAYAAAGTRALGAVVAAQATYLIADVASGAGSARLVLGTAAYQQTVVALAVDAAALRLVQRVASGSILSASAPAFAALGAGGGVLRVTVANTGAVRALFTVSVACPSAAPIAPVLAQQLTIAPPPAPDSTATLRFLLDVTSLGGWAGACTVTLVNGLGDVVATAAVAVNATATAFDSGAQGGTVAPGSPDTSGTPPAADGGCASCGQWDILCVARHLCVSALAGWGAGLAAALGAVAGYAFLAAYFPGLAFAPCRFLGGACSGASSCGGQRISSSGSHSHGSNADASRSRSPTRTRKPHGTGRPRVDPEVGAEDENVEPIASTAALPIDAASLLLLLASQQAQIAQLERRRLDRESGSPKDVAQQSAGVDADADAIAQGGTSRAGASGGSPNPLWLEKRHVKRATAPAATAAATMATPSGDPTAQTPDDADDGISDEAYSL